MASFGGWLIAYQPTRIRRKARFQNCLLLPKRSPGAWYVLQNYKISKAEIDELLTWHVAGGGTEDDFGAACKWVRRELEKIKDWLESVPNRCYLGGEHIAAPVFWGSTQSVGPR